MLEDFGHVEYPHEPGTLYDCMGCELGACTCDPEDEDSFGCVSRDCLREMFVPFVPDEGDDYWNPDYEEYYHGS